MSIDMERSLRVAFVANRPALRLLLMAQMERLVEDGFEVSGISAPDPQISNAENGIRDIDWQHLTRAWAPISDFRAFIELVRILRREKFDVVHTHNPKPGVFGRVAARLAGVPIVVNTVHGFYATPDDRWMKRFLVLAAERLAAQFSDLELYQSGEDLEWAQKIRLAASRKLSLLGNGVDLNRFDPSKVTPERKETLRRELGVPAGHLVVGTVGRLVAEKGFYDLAEAARLVTASTAEVTFLWVGPFDPAKPDAIAEAEIASRESGFIFSGWRQDVRDVLSVMDVFVLPSWREGLPRSAIEAAAMAKPLVLTDIRGCREVITDGVEGFLVPPRSPSDLQSAIGRLVSDADLRKQMGAAARVRALSRFDERTVVTKVVDSYRRLLMKKELVAEVEEKSPKAQSAHL